MKSESQTRGPGLDEREFGHGFVGEVVDAAGATIPIAGVAGIALDLVEHGVDPSGGRVVFVLLDELMRGLPIAGDGEIQRAEEFGGWSAHAGVLLR